MKQVKPKKIKIGILGEHPENDSDALKILLSKRPYDNIDFSVPIRTLFGGQLSVTKAVIKQINFTISKNDLDYFILVHDLDSILSNTEDVQFWDNWFEEINKGIDKRGLFFLVVAETEALILADIEAVNSFFKTKLKPYPNPMTIRDPKKELREQSAKINPKRRYEMNMSCDIFKKVDFETVYKNHKGKRSFQEFIDKLDEKFKDS